MAHILVVDDEAVLLNLIATVLRMDGHTVEAMGDPLSALDAFERGLKVDLLFTDIELTPITGFELVKRLNKKGIDIPVLYTSGYVALSGAVADRLGSRSILEKPFTAAQLRTAVTATLPQAKPKLSMAAARDARLANG